MKERNRNIFIVLITLIYTLVLFFFYPRESAYYLKSDIEEFQSSIVPISAILSFVVAFLAFFDKKYFADKLISKIIKISFIGLMSYFLFEQNSKIATTAGLYINRLAVNEVLIREFKVNFKMDNEPYVYGRIADENYDLEFDKVKIEQSVFNNIVGNETISLEFKKGILAIPYDPQKLK